MEGDEVLGKQVLAHLMRADKISLVEYSWLVTEHSHLLSRLAQFHGQPINAMAEIEPLLREV
jgi:hypothetical protein